MDAVLEVHVLHLVPDWKLALAEARRVLVPGGVVLIGRGGSHRRSEGPRGKTLRRFYQLARSLGGGPRTVGASENERKVAGLVALGGTAEPVEPLVWEQQETYAQALAGRGGGRPPRPGPASPGRAQLHPHRGAVLSPEVSRLRGGGIRWEP
jgi:SAM-dependent methyltransferase